MAGGFHLIWGYGKAPGWTGQVKPEAPKRQPEEKSMIGLAAGRRIAQRHADWLTRTNLWRNRTTLRTGAERLRGMTIYDEYQIVINEAQRRLISGR